MLPELRSQYSAKNFIGHDLLQRQNKGVRGGNVIKSQSSLGLKYL